MDPKRPHIVIFVADEFRGDGLGHMGNAAAVTPNADRLLSDGVSFRHAYCQVAECTPSRASLLTGWYPHTRGHRNMASMLRPDDPILIRRARDAGYMTWWGTGRSFDPPDPSFGMDAFCEVSYDGKTRCDLDVLRRSMPKDSSLHTGPIDDADDREFPDWYASNEAVDVIRRTPVDRPLFMHLDLAAPHPPYRTGRTYHDMIDPDRLPPRIPAPRDWRGLPSRYRLAWETNKTVQGWAESRWSELRRTYYGACARVDDQLGQVVAALKSRGIYDDTALFFFSDHGDFAGDYGMVDKFENTFPDAQMRVPLIVKPPTSVQASPRISDALVELTDVSATIEQLTGIASEHITFGRSLLPVITGETEDHRDGVFAVGGGTHEERRRRLLGTGGEQKYRPGANGYPKMIAYTREGPEYGKAAMVRTPAHKYVLRMYEPDELYDLRADPQELHNRIDDPALGKVQAMLKDRLLRFLLETGDVLMRGRTHKGGWPPGGTDHAPRQRVRPIRCCTSPSRSG